MGSAGQKGGHIHACMHGKRWAEGQTHAWEALGHQDLEHFLGAVFLGLRLGDVLCTTFSVLLGLCILGCVPGMYCMYVYH